MQNLRGWGYGAAVPLLDPPDPYCRPVRLPDAEELPEWDGYLDVEDGYGLLRDVTVNGPIDLDGCQELELLGCDVSNVSFADHPGIQLEISRCRLNTCDLSQARVTSLMRTRLTGCKFIGSDLSGTAIEDVIFTSGVFRYTNLRMSSYLRVLFADCRMDEADFYSSELTDVDFEGSELTDIVVDKARFERVDLRYALSLGLTTVGNLTGVLIGDDQVAALAYQFALASGVSIATTPNED